MELSAHKNTVWLKQQLTWILVSDPRLSREYQHRHQVQQPIPAVSETHARTHSTYLKKKPTLKWQQEEWKHAMQRNNTDSWYGCRKVGSKLFTWPVCGQRAGKHHTPSNTYSHIWGSVISNTSAAEKLSPFRPEAFNSGPEECSQAHNRKWRKRGSDWWKLCRRVGPRSPIGRRREAADVFSYRRPRLIDAYISIIYSAPNELLKVWFYMFGDSIFNVQKEVCIYNTKGRRMRRKRESGIIIKIVISTSDCFYRIQ